MLYFYLEVNVTEPEPVSETVANKVCKVFRNNYAKVASTLTDINHLATTTFCRKIYYQVSGRVK